MTRHLLNAALLAGALATATGYAQPPDRGGPGGRGPGSPPRFEPGRILPPHVREQIELTKEQEKTLADLEKLVKEKMERILTDEQRKKIGQAAPPGGPPGGGRGPGGPGGPPPGEKQKDGEPQAVAAGIQWFTTWETAKAEAARTGRPILLVSAAPHCAGVSGIW